MTGNGVIHSTGERTPNDPKLSDRGGAARHLPNGWNGGQMTKLLKRVERRVAGAVTEPGESGAGHRKLTAMPAVTCSAWLGVADRLEDGQ